MDGAFLSLTQPLLSMHEHKRRKGRDEVRETFLGAELAQNHISRSRMLQGRSNTQYTFVLPFRAPDAVFPQEQRLTVSQSKVDSPLTIQGAVECRRSCNPQSCPSECFLSWCQLGNVRGLRLTLKNQFGKTQPRSRSLRDAPATQSVLDQTESRIPNDPNRNIP
jgi:hypothetical protein